MKQLYWLAMLPGLLLGGVAAAAQVSIGGIMGDRALVSVDGGPPKVIRAGEEYQGIRVLEVRAGKVIVEDAGKRYELGLGSGVGPSAVGSARAGGNDGMALDGKAMLHADSRGHFTATVQINGVSSRFLVDTGATAVALPMSLARRAGITLPPRPDAWTATANGTIRAYRVTLDEVRLDGIKLYQVEGLVLDDVQLSQSLLGMSFLNRTAMQRDGDVMSLRKRY